MLLAWVAFDLYRPVKTHLREFDADEVARLETAMWRSYYSRERLRLFGQLAELLRTQYRLPLWRSNAVAYRAAKADEDWRRIDELLRGSWRSLRAAVNP